MRRTQNAVDELADPVVSEAWESINTAQRQVADGGLTGDAAAELLAPTQEAFETAETRLRDRLDTRLSEAGPQVSRPAGITSGAALLLGLVGAVFAWTGLSGRLKEYR